MENSFNINLRRIRKEKGITQEQLAEKVGVSPQAVSKWEISSYPDPQLLPAIADFLGVTIDKLYGRGDDEISLNQRVIEKTYSGPYTDEGRRERINTAVHLTRAAAMGCCGCELYTEIPNNVLNSKDGSNHTLVEWECGFIFGRLNANLQYMLVMPEPENGYDDVLAYNEKTVKLFEFFGMPNALRTMYFLAGRSTTIFFRIETLINELNITRQNAQQIINKMLEFAFIWEATLDGGKNDSEKIYQYLAGYTLIPFLTFTNELINRANGFNYQTSWRDNPYFKNDTYKRKKGERDNEEKK